MPHVQAGDVRLHYVEHSTGDEPIVFIHGYTGSARGWQETLPRLAPRFHAYAFDLRGAGESDRPEGGYDLPTYVEDIHQATRALGIETFTLVGHSMGGGTALLFALTYPERLRSLILVAPVGADGVPEVDEGIRTQMKALRQNKEIARTMAKAFMTRPLADALIELNIEDGLLWTDEAMDGAYASMRALNLGDRLAELSTPTLMVVGDRDFLRADNLRDAQRIPNCALKVYYRVGHLIPFDVPDEFAALIDDFIEHGIAPVQGIVDRAAAMAEIAATT